MKKIKFPKLPKLPKLPKQTSLRLTYEIGIAFFILLVMLVFVYGLGIYKYNWTRYGTKTITKFIPYPAAFVGPLWISMSQFNYQKDFILHFYDKTGTPLDNEREIDREIMDRIIEQKLVEREFKKQGLFVSQKEIDDEYKKIVEENQGEENVKKMLDDLYGMKPADLKRLIKDRLVIEKFKNEVLVSAHVAHILTKDQNRANDILAKLKAGENWDDLAKNFSEDENSRDKGGDLGFLQRGSLVSGKPMSKEFEQGVFSLNVGQISPSPVATEFGYHIFKVTEKKGKIDKSYEDWLAEAKSKTWIKKFIGK